MLKINKKVEYAMMVLKHMATKEDIELTSARSICDLYKTPFDSTAKVMQKLNSANILNSIKGIKGGYVLNRPLSEITYMELVKIIEGEEVSRVCESPKGKCENFQFCNIITPVEQLNLKLKEFLHSLNLEELLLSEEKFSHGTQQLNNGQHL